MKKFKWHKFLQKNFITYFDKSWPNSSRFVEKHDKNFFGKNLVIQISKLLTIFFLILWPILTKLIEICRKSRQFSFGENFVIWIFSGSLSKKEQGQLLKITAQKFQSIIWIWFIKVKVHIKQPRIKYETVSIFLQKFDVKN